jgi:Xaa-Pro aminopeptidase
VGIFSDVEIQRRVDRLRRWLADHNMDAAILHTADHVYYIGGVPLLSEWGRPMALVLSQSGDATLIEAAIEHENAARNSWITDLRPYPDNRPAYDAVLQSVVDFLNDHRLQRSTIGIELETIPFHLHQRLTDRLSQARFADVTPGLRELRIVKSAEELALLRLGGDIARIGANAFLDALHENTTELEVASHAVREMNRTLAALLPSALSSTYAYCHSGLHTLTPHLHPTGKHIRRGEVIALNVFPVISGYVMELERTFVFGAPNQEEQRALDAVNEAFDAGKAAIRPGRRAAEIDKLTRDILEKYGYGAHIRHGAGHGHGIMIGSAGREESGELRSYNETVLRAGMVNSMEPGVYIPSLGGFRHSDVLAITDEGYEDLSKFPRDVLYQAKR